MDRTLVYTKVMPTKDLGNVFIEIYQTPGTLIPYAEDLEDTFGYKIWKQIGDRKSSETVSGFGYTSMSDALVTAVMQSEKWL